jgi:hypothetical protein
MALCVSVDGIGVEGYVGLSGRRETVYVHVSVNTTCLTATLSHRICDDDLPCTSLTFSLPLYSKLTSSSVAEFKDP